MIPVLIALGVIALVCFLHALPHLTPLPDHPGESSFDALRKVEWITYDWRVRHAFEKPHAVATNLLAAVLVDDGSLKAINMAYGFSWPWPRQLHGKVVRELSAQGARVVAFDIFFIELQLDIPETRVAFKDGSFLTSDDFFARQIARAGNVLLGAPSEPINSNQWQLVPPAPLFYTNAMAVGHATSERDSDGVLRRVKPFKDDPTLGRIWHLGILMAAAQLKLDLAKAEVGPGRIVLRGDKGIERVIPLDEEGFLYIDWSLPWNDPRILRVKYEDFLDWDEQRRAGETPEPGFKDRLVVLGSTGSGNNVSDMGATPLEKQTFLVSKHWNVANSILTNRFIRTTRHSEDLAIIVIMGALAGAVTWKLRALWASFWVLILIIGYTAVSLWAFDAFRLWLPLVMPVGGALLMTHISMVTYRVVFEQAERRRVKSIFSKVVSPDVVNELLAKEKLSLGGALRKLTIFFADVRGFTQMTDENQRRAEEYVRSQNLKGAEAEAFLEENARETLATVNLYLATIADNVKKHNGTLDKYIGDCVMAFWGAPIPNPKHALACVRAAIDSQRAMYEVNQQRFAENQRREQENSARGASGLPPRPLLALLTLGTGINTGTVTVGLMGSEAHTFNYTVFGREVNLASRLEGVSGRGRIIISKATYAELEKDDPQLAATCIPQAPVTVKGITDAVSVYEVPWKLHTPPAPPIPQPPPAPPQPSSVS